MSKRDWRSDLDLVINENLKELIRETKQYNSAISKAKDKSKAQLWVALAILNNKLNHITYEKKGYDKKIPDEELSKILKTLEKL